MGQSCKGVNVEPGIWNCPSITLTPDMTQTVPGSGQCDLSNHSVDVTFLLKIPLWSSAALQIRYKILHVLCLGDPAHLSSSSLFL